MSSRWYRDYTALRRTSRYLSADDREGIAAFPGVAGVRATRSAATAVESAANDDAQLESAGE